MTIKGNYLGFEPAGGMKAKRKSNGRVNTRQVHNIRA
jgi:hypothetical protein